MGGPGVGWMRDRLLVNRRIVTSDEVVVIIASAFAIQALTAGGAAT
jgi:hypothetical protein